MPWNDPWFAEEQRFRQWWLWLLVLWGPVFFLWAIFQQVVMDVPIGDKNQPDERPDADLIGPDIRGRASGVDFCLRP